MFGVQENMRFISKIIIYSLTIIAIPLASQKVVAQEITISPLPISLSLKETIADTLKNNLSIAVQKYNSKIVEQSIFEKEADFDATLDFEFAVGEETRQAAGAFANPTKSRNQDYDWDFSIAQKFVTGGDYELSFDTNRNLTSSTFVVLNPQYTSDIHLSLSQPLL